MTKLLQQMDSESGDCLDSQQALRVLIDLTDELRRNKRYQPHHGEMIFKEADRRLSNIVKL